MTRAIALSGFMGAGKSTVGERLARELGWLFVDLDEEIEAAFAAPIRDVFARVGEAGFRAMEARLLRQVIAGRCVVALGGGAVVDAGSRAALKRGARWVHLDAPFDVLERRVARTVGDRPMWTDRGAAEALYAARAPMYAEAPHRVDATGAAATVVAGIRALLGAPASPPAVADVAPRTISVDVPGAAYEVRVGRAMDAAIAAIGRDVGAGPIALLTDWNVGPLHADRVATLLAAGGRPLERVVLPAGEARKRIEPVVDVVERLLDRGWQRSAPVVALGGGVLGDMAGLVASLTLRGVPFVQLPTTLLAMVDSSVGGKVGVDHREGKNLIGAFHQPSAVVADLAFLDTLPPRELRAGCAEAVKSGLAGDAALLRRLERRADDVLGRDPELLAEVVARCVAFKAEVVAEDALERGRRRVLNLGHTLGHGLEAATGYSLRHGEAVSIGLVAAAHLGVEHVGADAQLPARVGGVLASLGLPTVAPPVSRERLAHAMAADKKRVGDDVAWVLPAAVGDARIVPLPTRDLGDMLRFLEDRGILGGLE